MILLDVEILPKGWQVNWGAVALWLAVIGFGLGADYMAVRWLVLVWRSVVVVGKGLGL